MLHLLVYCRMQYPFPPYLSVSQASSFSSADLTSDFTRGEGWRSNCVRNSSLSHLPATCASPHTSTYSTPLCSTTVELSFTLWPSAAAQRQNHSLQSFRASSWFRLSLRTTPSFCMSPCVFWTLFMIYVSQPPPHSKHMREMVCKPERFILSLRFRGVASRKAGYDVAWREAGWPRWQECRTKAVYLQVIRTQRGHRKG